MRVDSEQFKEGLYFSVAVGDERNRSGMDDAVAFFTTGRRGLAFHDMRRWTASDLERGASAV